ncbi:MAG: YdeI/OmpD-associated family protein [Planctomycetota bacterium]|nr:YdeI/OmpD-associated family protein [Planctomycetota bacterium]
MKEFPRVQPRDRAAWRAWLARHHASCDGVWLVTLKVASGKPRVTYDDAVEEALCFGWVDSLPRKLDAERSMLLVTPRKKGSPWSGLNKRRVAKLKKAGLMEPAGLAAIERAKADGSWTLYDEIEALVIPPDLAAALNADANAARHFGAFPPSAKKGILWWLKSAKREATRAARIATIVAKAAENKRANLPGQ